MSRIKRPAITIKQQVEIFERDFWHCRYCLRPVFFAPALKLLDALSPEHSYYHKNGKTGAMLPLFQWSWASVDHVIPLTAGGIHHKDNFVSACWQCNLLMNNTTKEQGRPDPKPITDDLKQLNWDGFYGIYLKLNI